MIVNKREKRTGKVSIPLPVSMYRECECVKKSFFFVNVIDEQLAIPIFAGGLGVVYVCILNEKSTKDPHRTASSNAPLQQFFLQI